MGVKFTDEQQRAIDTLDKSILVSAAAGSGKTAVLIQRIINIILSGEADVDQMLVVTFTNAAAAEMRLKLARAIKQRMQEDPSSRKRLKDQLSKLYRANISTFNSFAIRVIREFFYEIDIEPEFKTCDEIRSELFKRNAVDSLFEEGFGRDDLIEGGSFREFLRLYSDERSENRIKNDIIATYDRLRSMPNYWDWAYDKAEHLRAERDGKGWADVKNAILADIADAADTSVRIIESVRDMFEDHGIGQKFLSVFGHEYNLLTTVRQKACNGILDDELVELIIDPQWNNMAAYKNCFEKNEDDLKKIYTSFKTEITPLHKLYVGLFDSIRMKYFVPDLDTRIREMNETYAHTVYFLDLCRAFETKYEALKKEAGMLDFSDMDHLAVRILDRPVPAETLKNRFRFIFIDEYQDTNHIQEYLIGCFAKEDNVFRVGDVKQSIYRFRQAEPSLFEDVYNKCSSGRDENAIAIDLNSNFRSNDGTVQYINTVFRDIMDGYDSRAELNTGQTKYAYKDKYDFIPDVYVLDETPQKDSDDDAAADGTEDLSQAAGPEDGEIENIGVAEAEARFIADLIEDIVGTEFCDTVTGEVRKAEARDIAVLFRSVKVSGDLLTRALREKEIQAHVEDNENYFDTVEVGIAMSLFSCIDNMKRDVPLIATLHSEVFGWTPSELAEVRSSHRKNADKTKRHCPYWEALAWYAENGEDAALRAKTLLAYDTIREWRKLSGMMAVPDFIWKVLVDSGYYLRAGAMYDGDRRQANLRVLVERARQYSEDTVASLSDFLGFVDIMKTRNIRNGQVSMVSSDDDVVRITTIHKSKGLEYPFVIVGGLGRRFRHDDIARGFAFDSKLGVGLHYVSSDRRYWRSTIMQRAINSRSRVEGYKEDLRVLYVAMTRARNKLCLVGTAKKVDELQNMTVEPAHYLKVMRNVLDTDKNNFEILPLETTHRLPGATRIKELLASRPDRMGPETLKIYDEIERRLSYRYPDENLLSAKTKYSVSAIRREELDAEREAEGIQNEDEVVNIWQLTDKRKRASASDIGIAYHRIMEFLDFRKVLNDGVADEDYIRERAYCLLNSGALDENAFRHVEMGRITEFFESDLGRRAAAAAECGTIRKEKAFTLATDWKGREILVQGVVDCCWKETDADGNEQMVVVDYKTNYISPKKPITEELERIKHEYATQIRLYSQALEEGTGVPVKEAYLYLFAIGCVVEMQP